MKQPEYATDYDESLMHLTLDADEIDAIVILEPSGRAWSRLTDHAYPAEVAFRLRELADGLEKGEL